MTREEVSKEVISLEGHNFLLELATGTGKSKIAIDKLKSLYDGKNNKVLIVVPRNLLKGSWKDELKKWWKDCPLDITYSTYMSYPKHAGEWWAIIYDECHHISERCQSYVRSFKAEYSILCSATVKKKQRKTFNRLFNPLVTYRKDLREVIESNILPDPTVYLIPLKLSTHGNTELIMKNKSAKGKPIKCTWSQRWNFMKQKKSPVYIECTEWQYYNDMESLISFYKKKAMAGSKIAENMWLHACGMRLRWLSNKKIGYLFKILSHLRNYRTLTFCNNIEQTELLGSYCINSKNKKSDEYKRLFNEGRIDHITACDMLNEGANLVNCQVGIYANLNNSDIIIKQRMGRLLRHPNPVIVIPYFINTRDEDLVNKMKENYNPELIKVIYDINDIEI